MLRSRPYPPRRVVAAPTSACARGYRAEGEAGRVCTRSGASPRAQQGAGFSSALRIEQTDWRYLRDQLVEGVVEAPVLGTRTTPFGVLYEVVVIVNGLNGATAPVATIWIIDADRPPQLVSTWVDIP